MKIDLSGKIAIVTASTTGIGRAIVEGLASAGAHVVLNGRTQEKVDEAVSMAKRAVPHANVQGIAADLSQGSAFDGFVARAPTPDILVNNLGIFNSQGFFDIPDTEWMRFFETNVMSGVRLSRAYLGGMMQRNWGRVVFISSESAINIPPEMIHYGMTKTALLSLSRGLAKLTSGTGVTVNAILPGPTRSDGVETFIHQMATEKGVSEEEAMKSFIEEHRSSSIIQRFATVQEVANMVVYACSSQASATNGAALRVDGGVIDTIA